MNVSVAIQLTWINSSQIRKDNGLCDTSDDGYYMNFRNETYNGEEFKWTAVWCLPDKVFCLSLNRISMPWELSQHACSFFGFCRSDSKLH
jgi:hypothetical protein